MGDVDLNDLVSRLRNVTGHAAVSAEVKSVIVGRQLKAECKLLLQHALRRHPALQILSASREAAMQVLFQQMEDALNAPASVINDALRLFQSINELSEKLEQERIRFLYHDVREATEYAESRALGQLGMDAMPKLSQNHESYPCPWHVLFALLAGESAPGMAHLRPGALSVPNPTVSMIADMQLLHESRYDVVAWKRLLDALDDFPIASVRGVYHVALHYFPSSAVLVRRYLDKEIKDVDSRQRLDECLEEEDAIQTMKDYLRILNFFYRHLRVCFDVPLYTLFLNFIGTYVSADDATMGAVYRYVLQMVGQHPQSTPLWTRYLTWRTGLITVYNGRRDFTKKLYRHMLQIPLMDLEKVKQDYDSFIAAEYRDRTAQGDQMEVETRYKRVKVEASELEKLMSWVKRDILFLPLPAAHRASTGTAVTTSSAANPFVLSDEAEQRSQEDIDIWMNWCYVVESVNNPLFVVPDATHWRRCRYFYLMRACFFAHRICCWSDLLQFCVSRQYGFIDSKERESSIRQGIELALHFMPQSLVMNLFCINTLVNHLHDTTSAQQLYRQALQQEHGALLYLLKSHEGAAITADVASTALQCLSNLTVAAVNWMRLSIDVGPFHIRLVARFVMHTIDFLSLTMRVVKTLLKAEAVKDPHLYLQPFNTFCDAWIFLELVRNRNVEEAFLVLRQWKEHLYMMLKSGVAKHWSPEQCGVDELFFHSCGLLLRVWPAKREAILAFVRDMAALVDGSAETHFFYHASKQCHDAFVVAPASADDAPHNPSQAASPPTAEVCFGLQGKLVHPEAVLPFYDTQLYASNLLEKALAQRWRHVARAATLAPPTAAAAEGEQGRYAKAAKTEDPHVYPEETQWSALTPQSAQEMRPAAAPMGGAPFRRRRPFNAPAGNALDVAAMQPPRERGKTTKRAHFACAWRPLSLAEFFRQRAVDEVKADTGSATQGPDSQRGHTAARQVGGLAGSAAVHQRV
ncbi:hypothetical protein STCU_08889 [Strigomonas culicis]|uniref:Suppressor of forked domain-containing protein n=1 Tax=Strigomonas culicis TaxID=28005 RepID=S9TVS6_9TRYP|nr:hypothetical protein STCU_08889 [Strigomonas culicis]|eukprot:EPY20673.1 hypothetical protein STCU_08889 [Strigomonas culicis]